MRERIEAGRNERAEDDECYRRPGGKFEQRAPQEYIHHAHDRIGEQRFV